VTPDDWANLEVRTVGLLPWLHLCWSALVCAWLSQESLTSGLLGGRVLGVVDLEQVVLAMAIEIRHQCLHEHLYFGRLGSNIDKYRDHYLLEDSWGRGDPIRQSSVAVQALLTRAEACGEAGLPSLSSPRSGLWSVMSWKECPNR